MTQLNTPYPATAFLTGTLKKFGYENTFQADPSIDLVDRLFTKESLKNIHQTIKVHKGSKKDPSLLFFEKNYSQYESTIEEVKKFLQGKDPSLAMRIVSRTYLPEGPLFSQIQEEEFLDWAFGALGIQDRAKYFASLYLDEVSLVIQKGVCPHFSLSRYAEKLAASSPSFEPLDQALHATPTLIEEILEKLTDEYLKQYQPTVVGLTAPFPGNVYGAFQIAKRIKQTHPQIKTVLGGGYVNTELRSLEEPRVFDYFDYVLLDDGEKPFLNLLEYFEGKRKETDLLRTFRRVNDKVQFCTSAKEHDLSTKDWGVQTYAGLPLDRYLSILEVPNPMHRLWSDCRWNKIMVAHGCYWKKCSFCDTSLDYIGRYDPGSVDWIIERMDSLIKETGQTGFHLIDEAAPPKVLKNLSKRILEKGMTVTWWGNIRFEKSFDAETAALMAKAGCVAVSGGLEVASDRLLSKMQKGVTVEQVAQVTRNFRDAGILVHAYLMYGFPTQTEQETIDSLERVRQLFAQGLIQSAYWHRFSATAHSPIGHEPQEFGVEWLSSQKSHLPLFSRNDLQFKESGVKATDHGKFSAGLKKAVYNYMHGIGLDEDVRSWFEFRVPRAQVKPHLIESYLS